MARRGNAVHVVTTTRRYKGRTYKNHLLRRSYREGDKVKNETVGNLSHLPEEIIELIRRALRGESFIAADEAFQIVRSRPHGHVAAVLGILERLGLDRLMASRRSAERDRCVAMIVARVLTPGSKLATTRQLSDDSATSTLGEQLDLGEVEADELYAAMDWLLERQPKIEQALAKRHLSNGTLVLYDVSSSYLEGRHCPLGRIGHSRDGKKGSLQIVYGLLCNAEGCPVAVEVYEGNTGDPTTLGDQIRKLRERFGLERVVFVGDRGLLTSARISEELRPVEGLTGSAHCAPSRSVARERRWSITAVALRYHRSGRDPPSRLPGRTADRLPEPAASSGASEKTGGSAQSHRAGSG